MIVFNAPMEKNFVLDINVIQAVQDKHVAHAQMDIFVFPSTVQRSHIVSKIVPLEPAFAQRIKMAVLLVL